MLVVAAAAAAGTIACVWAPTAVAAVVSAVSLAAVAGVYLTGGPRRSRIPAAPAHLGAPTERRLLLLVNDLRDGEDLAGVCGRADTVLVLSPAATSPLRHWVSDVDRARDRARERMEVAVSRLRDVQVEASGVVGDDAFSAVDDALRTFGGDEIVVAGGNESLLGSLRARYAIPVGPMAAREDRESAQAS